MKKKNIVFNSRKDPEDPDYKYKSTHAEYSLLKSHKRDCSAIKHILVIRVKHRKNKPLLLKMSKPCTICQKLLIAYGVETVTYSTDDADLVTKKVSDISDSD